MKIFGITFHTLVRWDVKDAGTAFVSGIERRASGRGKLEVADPGFAGWNIPLAYPAVSSSKARPVRRQRQAKPLPGENNRASPNSPVATMTMLGPEGRSR